MKIRVGPHRAERPMKQGCGESDSCRNDHPTKSGPRRRLVLFTLPLRPFTLLLRYVLCSST